MSDTEILRSDGWTWPKRAIRGRGERSRSRTSRWPSVRGSKISRHASGGSSAVPPLWDGRGGACAVKRAWHRLDALVPTWKGAALLFALALAGYWLAAAGWPLAKGRDTWDYLAYYLPR